MTKPLLAVTYEPFSVAPLDLTSDLRSVADLIWVTEQTELLGATTRLLRRFGEVIDADTTDSDDIVSHLRDLRVEGMAWFTEPSLRLASRIGSELGLRVNPPEVAEALTDKHRQREVLGSHGIPVPGSALIPGGSSEPDIAARTAALTLPGVLKPAQGSGSQHTTLVGSVADISAALVGHAREDFVVEEYLRGRNEPAERPGCADRLAAPVADFVSVEGFVDNGRIFSLGVTGRFRFAPPFRETGSIVPSTHADQAAAAVEMAEAAVSALGVRWGAVHTELKLTADGPRVVEVNGRVGGSPIPDLYRRLGGANFRALAAQIAVGAEGGPPLEGQPKLLFWEAGPYAWAYVLQAPVTATRVVRIGDLGALEHLPGVEEVSVRRSPGEQISWAEGSASAILVVSGTAATTAELEEIPDAVNATVDIEYEH